MSRRKYGRWRDVVALCVNGSELVIRDANRFGDLHLPVALGLVLHDDIGKFQLRSSGNDHQVRLQLERSGDTILLVPPYSGTSRLAAASEAEQVDLEFRAIDDAADRARCLELLKTVHYLDVPQRGVFLAGRFGDIEQQRRLFRNAPRGTRKRQWARPGAIVACAVIDTLMHGQPNGRTAIANALGYTEGMARWSRRETVDTLRVAWLSRVAVAPPFQRLGVGTRLATHARRLACQMFVPKTDFLEVIRSFPANHSEQAGSRQDFLVQAGFVKVEQPMRSKPCSFPRATSQARISQRAVKYYYYADVRNDG